jgi:nitrate/nitrite transport system substrate-binding protein
MELKQNKLKLGFLPLMDCAVLVVAREKGFFAAEGLEVELVREVSWANIRDKVSVGALDGAQMLAPMPIAISVGLSGMRIPMTSGLSLGLNGNAITVSNSLFEQLQALDPHCHLSPQKALAGLKQLVIERRHNGEAPLTFAMVYPYSCHNYQLRYWLAAGGIDPDNDINLMVIPPPQMETQLAGGRIDGFCVGEPWNQVTMENGHGHRLLNGYDIWNNAPEKVFAVRTDWAVRHPETHQALLRALLQAAAWIEQPGHYTETVKLLSAPGYLHLPTSLLDPIPDNGTGHIFHRFAANFPWQSHAIWLLTQMYRWRQLTEPLNMHAIARGTFNSHDYRQAAASLGIPCPEGDSKTEGEHDRPWEISTHNGPLLLGADAFIDNRRFNPEACIDYLYDFDIAHIGPPRSLLEACHTQTE